jgi:hypothetical protein
VWESIAEPNLAGREHLIAVAAAIVLGLFHGRASKVRQLGTVLLSGAVPLPRHPIGMPLPVPVASGRTGPSAPGVGRVPLHEPPVDDCREPC